MKKIKSAATKIAILCLTAACIFSAVSCATKKNEYVYEDDDIIFADREAENPAFIAPAITDEFLGDFDPLLVKSCVGLQKFGKKMKPKELTKNYLVPRTNNLEIHYRAAVNKICIILNYEERQKLKETAEQFLNEYETKTIDRHKVNKKTAYYSSQCSLWYGLSGLGSGSSKCDYWTNAEIINKHAYFLIHFTPSRTDDGKDLTPKENLYFSPTQLRDFIEILDQDYLIDQVKDLRSKAYTY